MNTKYYKENKINEEKVLRIDLDRFQEAPVSREPEAKKEKVYEVMFVKHSMDEGMAPIVAPGFLPESAMKKDNAFGFNLTEISSQEFYLYVQKAIEQFWDIVDPDGMEESVPQEGAIKSKQDETSTSHTN